MWFLFVPFYWELYPERRQIFDEHSDNNYPLVTQFFISTKIIIFLLMETVFFDVAIVSWFILLI
jgi:hypothetical protein